MTRRSRILLALGLAFGTVLSVWFYLSSLQPNQPVVIVSRDIAPHTPVTVEMLKVLYVHGGSLKLLAGDAFTAMPSSDKGLVATRPIKAGEVLRNSPEMVASPQDLPRLGQEARVPLSALVPAGHRAVTIPVEEEAVVRSGDLVDLFRTVTEGERNARSEVLLRGVPVLLGGGGGRTITVLVREGQEVTLVEALRSARVDVVLAPLGSNKP